MEAIHATPAIAIACHITQLIRFTTLLFSYKIFIRYFHLFCRKEKYKKKK